MERSDVGWQRNVCWGVILALSVSLFGCASNLYQRAQIYESRGDYQSAFLTYQQLAERYEGKTRARANIERARLLIRFKRYDEARELLEQVREEIPSGDPEYARASYYLGYCYYEMGDLWVNYALTTLAQALPTVPKAHLYLSVLYYEHGEYEAAIRHAEQIRGEDEAQAKYLIALAHEKQDQLEDAIVALQQAIELETNRNTKDNYQKKLAIWDKELTNQRLRKQKIVDIQLHPIFAALAPYYIDHPIGRVLIRNPSNVTLKDITLSLELGDLLNEPMTYDKVESLPPQGERWVPLTLPAHTKLRQIRDDLESVPVKLSLQYTVDQVFHETAPTRYVHIYEPHKIRWDPIESIVTFVTHEDEVVTKWSRHAALAQTPIEKAIQIYESLNLAGLQYEHDPQDPYRQDVDYIFYPRETLSYGKGDCDDLSVLYAACLENIGIRTALAITPTHVFVMFDSGMSETRAQRIIPSAEFYEVRDGIAWIPVEVTQLGRGSFFDAWLQGSNASRTEYQLVLPSQSWQTFPPATVMGKPGETPLPDREAILKAYNRSIAQAKEKWKGEFEKQIQYLQRQLGEGGKRDADIRNRLGVRFALAGRFQEAEEQLRQATLQVPSMGTYHNNLGNVLLLQGKTDEAEAEYAQALQAITLNPVPVHFNRAILHFVKGQPDQAQQELSLCIQNPESTEQLAVLARELGIPLQMTPRAGDLTTEVEGKMLRVTSQYQQTQQHEATVDALLEKVLEALPPEDRQELHERLMLVSPDKLREYLQTMAQPIEQAEPSNKPEAGQETGSVQEPISPPKLSRDQLEGWLHQVFEDEVPGTRAAGISEPEELQWWLHWME